MPSELSPKAKLEQALATLFTNDGPSVDNIYTSSSAEEIETYPIIRILIPTYQEILTPGSGVYRGLAIISLEAELDQLNGTDYDELERDFIQTLYFDTDLAERITNCLQDFTCYGAVLRETNKSADATMRHFVTEIRLEVSWTPRD